MSAGADPLDLIAGEAAGLEAADATAGPPGAPPAPPVDPAAEWREAANMAGGLVMSLYPELREDWTAPKLDNFGNALAKCAEHYGWELGTILGHPLVGLAFATWPLGVPLVRVAKQRGEAAAKRREIERGKAGESPQIAGGPGAEVGA